MCLCKSFTFECGCESQPSVLYTCLPTRAGQRGVYRELDHRGSPPGCRHSIVNEEIITPGKCASHRVQARIEKKIRELKEEIKLLKDDIAEYQHGIRHEEEERRARNQLRQGQYRVRCGNGGRGGHDSGRP